MEESGAENLFLSPLGTPDSVGQMEDGILAGPLNLSRALGPFGIWESLRILSENASKCSRN